MVQRNGLASGPFWAITAYFNPAGYEARRTNFRTFRDNLKLPLVAVELAFDGDFELTDTDAEILVRLSGGDVLSQKERLLNIALKALPPHCRKVAWLDCDVVFSRTIGLSVPPPHSTPPPSFNPTPAPIRCRAAGVRVWPRKPRPKNGRPLRGRLPADCRCPRRWRRRSMFIAAAAATPGGAPRASRRAWILRCLHRRWRRHRDRLRRLRLAGKDGARSSVGSRPRRSLSRLGNPVWRRGRRNGRRRRGGRLSSLARRLCRPPISQPLRRAKTVRLRPQHRHRAHLRWRVALGERQARACIATCAAISPTAAKTAERRGLSLAVYSMTLGGSS